MKIYLVRHGIATERIGGAILNDAMRPLTDEGRTETKDVANGLKRLGVRPDFYVTSPLVRAKQTAEICAEVLGKEAQIKVTDTLAPAGNVRQLYKFLRELGSFEEAMLFGHEPDIGMLTASLLDSSELQIPFKKAAVCRVDIYDMPPTAPGTLKWFITQKIAASIN